MTEPVGLSNQPFYVRERKDWAIQQEIYRHDQALYSIGEMAIFVMLWNVEDFNAGLTSRCSRCFGRDDLDGRSANIYSQANKNKCPICYGTSFEGGIRARIVRPALFTDTDDDEEQSRKGAVHPQRVNVETTNDFRYRAGDFVFRIDGSRWQLRTPTRVTLRTGFEHPGQATNSIGYSMGQASLEDATSVAFLIPPNSDALVSTLRSPVRYPASNVNDLINGPLIPKAVTD